MNTMYSYLVLLLSLYQDRVKPATMCGVDSFMLTKTELSVLHRPCDVAVKMFYINPARAGMMR